MVEELPGTRSLSIFRVPLADFIEPPPVKNGESVPSQHPTKHFRNSRGFYVCQNFCNTLGRHLQAKPSKPREEFLFLNILKRDCIWRASEQMFEGRRRPVPWWLIKPLLFWQESRQEGTLLPSALPTVFFMEVRDENDDPMIEPVSLSLKFGTLHTEWHLGILDTDGGDLRCFTGQVFLAVA